jgi:hypothetical protein
MKTSVRLGHRVAALQLSVAVRKDEVADIENKAARMAEYAKRARDGELIGYATEIKKYAERRLGDLMEEDRKAGRLAKPGNPYWVSKKPNSPTLANQGIDKNLADRARKAAAMTEARFEAACAKGAFRASPQSAASRPLTRHAARSTRMSISLRSVAKSIGLVNSASAPFFKAWRLVSASP